MEQNNWQVQIRNTDYSLMSDILIWRNGGLNHKEIQILRVDPESGCFIETLPLDGAYKLPTFRIKTDEAMAISKAFMAYANSQGFKNSEETFAKGKLEATERHLEDMRKIVFEPVIIGSQAK